MNMRKDIIEKKELIESWVIETRPKLWMAKELNCKIDTLDSYLKKWNIHYSGNRGSKGYKLSPIRKTAEEYSKKNIVQSSKLRIKLIEDGIKKEECEKCGITSWLGEKIGLELHHVDGNRHNNNIENLQILCPNCHSLTPNHSMKKVYTSN